MPDLIKNGHLYIGVSPLFINKIGNKTTYTFNEIEQAKFLQGNKGKTIDTQRIKGLGELNVNVFRDLVMNKTNRQLLQVKIKNEEEASDVIRMLQGTDSSHRKRLIEDGHL